MMFSNEYYSRLYVLKGIGKEGVKKLQEKKVAIIGIGGLGSAVAYILVANGIGKLRLIDQDIVEISNINRQFLYTLKDLRYPKVEVAYKKLKEINPKVEIEAIAENLNLSNSKELLKGCDLVIDGLDNVKTRYILNYVCVKEKIPYIFGASLKYEGNVSLFYSPYTPCFNCIFPNLKDENLETCETSGVINTVVTIIASIQANEAINFLIRKKSNLFSKLLVFDVASLSFDLIDINKRKNCEVCSRTIEYKPEEISLTWLCGSNLINVNPLNKIEIDIEETALKLKKYYRIILQSSLILVIKYDNKEISLFKNGRMLIKNIQSEKEALEIYNKIINKLLS